MDDINLYDRQKDLDLWIPKVALVIGVGGVGGWVALNLALVGVKRIIIFDDDRIEKHNLNRTPFRLSDVEKFKVEAIQELIVERRDDCIVDAMPDRFNSFSMLGLPVPNVVVDGRDNSEDLPDDIRKKVRITGGYDGDSITFHEYPSGDSVWGEEGASPYTVIPSFVIPAQLIANVIVGRIVMPHSREAKENIQTLDVGTIYDMILGGIKE